MSFDGVSEPEVNEIIEYGIWRGKIILISAFVAISLSKLMGIFCQGIIFWICLCAIRRYAGGYHADTQNRCFLISFIILILSFLWIKRFDNIGIIGILVQSIMLLIILFLAPVENKNHILDEREKQKYGKKTRRTTIILYAAYILLYVLNAHKLAISIEVSFIVSAISLIAGAIKNRRELVNCCGMIQ